MPHSGGGRTRNITGFETNSNSRHSEHSEESSLTNNLDSSVVLLCSDYSGCLPAQRSQTPYGLGSLRSHGALPKIRPQNDMLKKLAFTLAEVLITLGIIGVVAAMTIPTLMANIQKQQTVVKLKKAYAEINQALKMAENDHDSITGWNFSNLDFDSGEQVEEFGKNYLFPYMKVANTCIKPTTDVCWSGNVKSLDNDRWGTLNNNRNDHASFVTMSGYSVYYWIHNTGTGGWVFIDINGNRQPNVLGKDVFAFALTFAEFPSVSGLQPVGRKTTNVPRQDIIDGNINIGSYYLNRSGCKKGGGSFAGLYCAALIMQDGWTISKDYPW